MGYIVGIDGGGTKTKLVVIDEEGEELFASKSGPSNILSSGYERARASIHEVIKNAVIDNKLDFKSCLGMCIGVAGGGRAAVREQIEAIIRETGYEGRLIVTHDGETSLIGGTKGEAGLLIVAGTGAICYGINDLGCRVRVSGWGHLIGDEGSAYSIGIRILRAVMKSYDGRLENTILSELLLDKLSLSNEEEIVSYVYNSKITKEHIAALAILIEEGIKQKDGIAIRIADETVEDLVETVLPACKKLGFTNQCFKLIIDGSVLVNNTYIRESFIEKITNRVKGVTISTMEKDAAYGAALMVLRELER